MLRELTTCLALVVGMSVAGGGSAARVPAVHAGETDQSVDLSGTWRLDPERSDMGGPPRGAGPGPGMRSGGGPPGGMGRRGTRRTEHYRLEDKGRTLVVETTVEVEGLPSRTMKHVYRRTGG